MLMQVEVKRIRISSYGLDFFLRRRRLCCQQTAQQHHRGECQMSKHKSRMIRDGSSNRNNLDSLLTALRSAATLVISIDTSSNTSYRYARLHSRDSTEVLVPKELTRTRRRRSSHANAAVRKD